MKKKSKTVEYNNRKDTLIDLDLRNTKIKSLKDIPKTVKGNLLMKKSQFSETDIRTHSNIQGTIYIYPDYWNQDWSDEEECINKESCTKYSLALNKKIKDENKN